MAETLFKSILVASAVGGVFILFLSLIKPLTRKSFGGRWNYYMFIGVMLIMLLPVRIPIPSVVEHKAPAVFETEDITINVLEYTDAPEFVSENEQTIQVNLPKVNYIDYFGIASQFWIIVFLCLVIWKVAGYCLLLRKIRKTSYEDFSVNVKRGVRAVKSSCFASPFVTGIIKPVLVLPDMDLTETQLENILSHELIHLKRRDVFIKFLLAITKCIHWFNPFVYILAKQLERECEISCDLEAVRGMDESQRQAYMTTILELVSKSGRKNSFSTAMSSSKRELKNRFMTIKRKRNVKKWVVSLSVVLGAALIVGAFLIGGFANDAVSEKADIIADEAEGNSFNMLFIGEDTSGRCDTVAVVSFNEKGVTALSLPRDVTYKTSGGDKKLTEIMLESGEQAVFDAVKEKLSIPLSYYLKLNLPAVEKIVDAVGGVEFDVPMDMDYKDPVQNLEINLKKGKQHLSGKKVREMLQYRRGNNGGGYESGDIGRISLGQSFVKDFIRDNLKNLSPKKLGEIADIISKNTVTNIPKRKLLDFAEVEDVRIYTIPGYTITSDNGIMVYQIDLFSAKELLKPFKSSANKEKSLSYIEEMVKNLAGEDYEILTNSAMEADQALDKEFLGGDACKKLNEIFGIELGHNFGIRVNVKSLALWNEKEETNAGCGFVYHIDNEGNIDILGEKMLTYNDLSRLERIIAEIN